MNNLNPDVLVKVVLGAGGVGKTTVSAVLGLLQAEQGQRVLVITLDPARRLLDALGLTPKGSAPTKISLARFFCKKPAGSLDAYMPDLKKEWRNFLAEATKNAAVLHKIADNPFYGYVINGLPGALEVICAHILCRFVNSQKYDVIILDTPPASNSVAFLDVPKKVAALLEQSLFRSMFSPKKSFLLRLSKKLAFFSGSLIQNTLERLIGSHFLSELIDFALSIDSLYEPMLERSRLMDELLTSEQTKYVLVCKPEKTIIDDCLNLRNPLRDRGIFIDKIVVNQAIKNMDEKALHRERAIFAKAHSKDEPMIKLMAKLLRAHEEDLRQQEQQIARLQGVFSQAALCKLLAQKPKAQGDLLTAMLAELLQQAG